MADDSYDAIIVGAGPAGAACAYTLAKAGRNVLLVERGNTPGAKNMSGGRLYTYALEMLEPDLYKRAPLQRNIVREQVMLLGGQAATTVDFFDPVVAQTVPQSYSVVRASLDEWFASEAETQGATLACGVVVDGLVEEGGRVAGIRSGDEEIRASVVVAADGINSQLARQAGLFADISPDACGIGIKETIELPDDLINARFGVTAETGAARVVLGCTNGIPGGGFIYTNKGSISIGAVVKPDQLRRQQRHIQDIFQDFKMHPAILPLIENGNSIEYGAHLVPEYGYNGIPRNLSREGLVVVGDAARFGINTGLIIRGMDLAIVSGLAAGRAIHAAEAPAEVGERYRHQLDELLLTANQYAYRNVHRIFDIPRLFREYPEVANDAMRFLFRVDGKRPKPMLSGLLRTVRRNVPLGRLATDGWKVLRSL